MWAVNDDWFVARTADCRRLRSRTAPSYWACIPTAGVLGNFLHSLAFVSPIGPLSLVSFVVHVGYETGEAGFSVANEIAVRCAGGTDTPDD